MNRVRLTKDLSELKIKETLSSNPWLLVCDDLFEPLFREWGIDPERLVMVDDISRALQQAETYKLAIVCTEKPEGPTQHALKQNGIHSIGLYSQLILRLSAGVGPRFYAPDAWKGDLEFAIMCLPRCGSTLVSRELKQIGAGNPVEHFRGFVQTLLRERGTSRFSLIKWWALVRSGRQVNGVFGTKVIYDFWKMAEKFMLDEEREHIIEFFKSVPIIYIERSDKYGQAVSDVIARRTGVWHLWNDGMKAAYEDKLELVGNGLADSIASYQKFRRLERELVTFLEANAGSVIKIDYDDLLSSPKQTIAEAGRRLGLTIPQSYLDSELSLQPTTSETHKLLRDQLRRELE